MRIGIMRGALILALALAVAASAAGMAQDKPVSGKAAAPAASGVQVAIDPATGQLRAPTPEEMRTLSASLEQLFRQSTEDLKPEERADGTLVLDLQGSFLNAALIQKSADGTLKLNCTSDIRQARALFGLAPAPRPQPAAETE